MKLSLVAGALVVLTLLPGGPVEAASTRHPLPPGSQAMCLQNVRLRPNPSTAAPALKTLRRGQVLSAMEIHDTGEADTPYRRWCRVEDASGEPGWVSLDYLSLNRPGPEQVSARPPRLIHLETSYLSAITSYAALGLSGKNKPNGRIYRGRSHRHSGTGQWIGPDVPEEIPRVLSSGLELSILDDHPDGWLAFYRTPPMTGDYDSYEARFYGRDEVVQLWALPLDAFLPVGQPREIQDIRYLPPLLVFNSACASYSREVDNRCSELVAVRPESGEEVWRTPSLVSNDIFIAAGEWLFCGYGFTDEPDFLYIVDKRSGRVAAMYTLDSAADYMEIREDELWVTTYNFLYKYRLDPWPPSGHP
jgi:hypothetical protein